MRPKRAVRFIAIALVLTLSRAENYTEELVVQGLSGGSMLAQFEFSASASLQSEHAGIFPSALLHLAQQYGVQQLELSLTQGRWHWEQQAQVATGPVGATLGPKPPGLELKVSFCSGRRGTQAAYAALTQALGGLLCAGVATVPQLAVMAAPTVGWFAHQQPALAAAMPAAAIDGEQQQAQGHSSGQVYAWLPHEGVCSENLAAWRRLLPCRHHAGLAALLNPLQLAAAPYHSLGLHLWVSQQEEHASALANNSSSSSKGQADSSLGQPQGRSERLELRQVLMAVLPQQAGSTGAGLQQAQQAGQGQQQQRQQKGLLAAVFGSVPPEACPAASSTSLYVAAGTGAPQHLNEAAGSSRGACDWKDATGGALLVCDLAGGQQVVRDREQERDWSHDGHEPPRQQQQQFDLPGSLLHLLAASSRASGSSTNKSTDIRPHQLPPQVVQHAVQRDSRCGTLAVGVRAVTAQPTDAAAAALSPLLHVMQLLPWQLLVDANSLRVSLNGQPVQPRSPALVWQAVDVRPDRTAVIELLLHLPADDTGTSRSSATTSSGGQSLRWHEVRLQVDYRAAFVSVFDHAPDASRGIDIPPAVATLVPPACVNSTAADAASMHGTSIGSGGDGSSGPPPLLQRLLSACSLQQQYSSSTGGTLIPLPIPDFSMPFNVICFTSTLLAILLGGVANVVLRSPEELAGTAVAKGGPPAWKRKLRRVVALLLLMAVLAVYLDRDLQRQLDMLVHQLVHVRVQAPEQHGEL